MKRITIYDVAKEADVSLATVSRVINDSNVVREDTRLRVQQAIEKLGYKPLCESTWPEYDEAKTIDQEKTIGVQVNGKVRAAINVSLDEDEEAIKEKALKEENVLKFMQGKEIVKVIAIKGRIVNIVVK